MRETVTATVTVNTYDDDGTMNSTPWWTAPDKKIDRSPEGKLYGVLA